MKRYIIGIGMGNPALLTLEARRAIDGCALLVGARRMLDCFPESGAKKVAASTPEAVAAALGAEPSAESAAVLVSGDAGFFSLSKGLVGLPELAGAKILCGISSLQYFCAQLGLSWEDAAVVSLHGREADLPRIVAENAKTFVLAGGENTPGALCARLCACGLSQVQAAVGEALSYPQERITRGTAAELSGRVFAPLGVLLLLNERPIPPFATHGLPDEAFLRGDVPMTKEEVRAVSVAKLRLRRGQILWDVGAGTGSISVEAARVLGSGAVYAIEREEAALELLRQNRARFGLCNLQIVPGSAPEALRELPAPDAVFIGGSSGKLEGIFERILQKNPAARIVLNAITLETVAAALGCFARFSAGEPEIVQLTVAKAKTVGSAHMMLGQNPIFILSAGGVPEDG